MPGQLISEMPGQLISPHTVSAIRSWTVLVCTRASLPAQLPWLLSEAGISEYIPKAAHCSWPPLLSSYPISLRLPTAAYDMQSSYLPDQTLSIINDYRTAQFCRLAAAVVLVYDTLLTLGHEVRYIWSRRLGVMSVLYFVNRYVEIASFIPAVVPLTPKSDAICILWNVYQDASTLLPYISWAIFSGIRVYALAGRRMYLAFIVFILNATFIIPDIYVYSKLRLPHCAAGPLQAREFTTLLVLSRVCTLVGEAIVIAATIKCTRKQRSRSSVRVNTSQSLSDVLLSNGIVCFSVPLILNVLITVLIANGSDAIDVARMGLTTFRDSLTSIFISRFFLELAQLAATQSASTAVPGETEPSVLTTHFSSDFSGVTYTLELDRFSGDFDDQDDHAGVR